MSATSEIRLIPLPGDFRGIEQALVPFRVPLGLPFVNPFAEKQMQFYAEYKITGITVDEAVTGILFGNFRPFTEVKQERYNRRARTRTLTFNPFTRQMEVTAGALGDMAVAAGHQTGEAMGGALGLIDWKYWVDAASTPDRMIVQVQTHTWLFGGRFRFVVKAAADGVILADDWTTANGNDMRSNWMMMANLALMTHPMGFHHIAQNIVDEVRRARAAGVPYVGEIGSPSIDECAGDTLAAAS